MPTYRAVKVPDTDQSAVEVVAGPFPADNDEAAGRIGAALVLQKPTEAATDYRVQVEAADGAWSDVALVKGTHPDLRR